MAKQMKGITICGDCVYYNMKKHRCTRGCTDEGDARAHFYVDCPLPDVRPVVQRDAVMQALNKYFSIGDSYTY